MMENQIQVSIRAVGIVRGSRAVHNLRLVKANAKPKSDWSIARLSRWPQDPFKQEVFRRRLNNNGVE